MNSHILSILMLALTIIPTGAAAQAITAGQHTRVETTNYADGPGHDRDLMRMSRSIW